MPPCLAASLSEEEIQTLVFILTFIVTSLILNKLISICPKKKKKKDVESWEILNLRVAPEEWVRQRGSLFAGQNFRPFSQHIALQALVCLLL